MTKINDLFEAKRGEGGYRENLKSGNTPLVSAQNTNNGVMDFVSIRPTFKAPAITVERVSGQAFVQLLDFVTVPDDITVLIPKERMSLKKIFFIASEINLFKWKFSYGRKLTQTRLKDLKINLSRFTEGRLQLNYEMLSNKKIKIRIQHNRNFEFFNIIDLFEIKKGDFHALDRLDEGLVPTVSRISDNNGVTGYYKKPKGVNVYKKGLITVSTVTGDAFVQLTDFIATDNVLICKSKRDLKITTLFFVQLMINLQKWKFSYGRQPYKRVFSKIKVMLPTKYNDIDEDYIEKLIKNCYGWEIIEKHLQ